MRGKKLALLALAAVCAISFGGEAFARGGGGPVGFGGGQGAGIRMQKRDGSCIRNTTATRAGGGQQLRNGAGMKGAGAGQGTGQGAMRRLGPGDGTGNTKRPMDGTGYGSPAK